MNILQNYSKGILKWYIFVFKDHRRKNRSENNQRAKYMLSHEDITKKYFI